jgi:hypothetical protein
MVCCLYNIFASGGVSLPFAAIGVPSVCDSSKPSPAYQVVIPRQPSEEELEDEQHKADEARRLAVASDPSGYQPPEHLTRSARPAPVPKECHSLGSLANASFSLLNPKEPSQGVSLLYGGGDDCLKKVMTREGTGAEATYLPRWVPTPRSLAVHVRCDTNDAGATDVSSFIQLARRVRVVETEMCTYVVEWPSKHGCPSKGKLGYARAKRAAKDGAASALAGWFRLALGLGLLGGVGFQAREAAAAALRCLCLTSRSPTAQAPVAGGGAAAACAEERRPLSLAAALAHPALQEGAHPPAALEDGPRGVVCGRKRRQRYQ